MNLRITEEGDDFGTVEFSPGRDDPFTISGYGGGEIKIAIPIYSHEAAQLIELLQPLADRDPEREESP